jgi:hypothetical protein
MTSGGEDLPSSAARNSKRYIATSENRGGLANTSVGRGSRGRQENISYDVSYGYIISSHSTRRH